MATLLASFPVLPSSVKYTIDSHPSFSASHPNPLFSSSFPPKFPTPLTIIPFVDSSKWSNRVSFSPGYRSGSGDVHKLKEELFEAIEGLDRGAKAYAKDQGRVDQIARKLEALNPVKEPLKCHLLNGKWELLYTTSQCVLQTRNLWRRKIYQALNLDTLRAQNLGSLPFYNQIPTESAGSGCVQIEITYLDGDLKITRGNSGDLFILKMVDPS